MKFSVQADFSDEEIRTLAADAARRGIVWGVQYIGQHVGDSVENLFEGISPQAASQIANILQQVMAAQAARPQAGPRSPNPADTRRPWPAVQFYASQPQQPPPGYGGLGVPPWYGAPPPGPGARVVPMAGGGAEIKECFYIEETPRNEACWGCCHCASPNGLQRSACRTCGHPRCGAVVTPAVAPPLQVPGATGVSYPPHGPPPFVPPTPEPA